MVKDLHQPHKHLFFSIKAAARELSPPTTFSPASNSYHSSSNKPLHHV
jgi:hypothetical protein